MGMHVVRENGGYERTPDGPKWTAHTAHLCTADGPKSTARSTEEGKGGWEKGGVGLG